MFNPSTFVFFMSAFIRSISAPSSLDCFYVNMSYYHRNGFRGWLREYFSDPIWEHHEAPWRRHSYPTRATEDVWDDSTAEFHRPGYPNSEPDRDPREWCTSWNTCPQAEPIESGNQASEATVSLHDMLEQAADPYWANRGWVLIFDH